MQGRTNVKDGIFLNANVADTVVTGNNITAGDFVELTGDTTQLEKIIDANYGQSGTVDISNSVRCLVLYDSSSENLRFVFWGYAGIVNDVTLTNQTLSVGFVSFENGYIYIANAPTVTSGDTSLGVEIKKYAVDNAYNVTYSATITLDSTCFDAITADIGSFSYAYPWGIVVNQGKIILSVRYAVSSGNTGSMAVYCANIDGSYNKKIGTSASTKWGNSYSCNSTNKYIIYSSDDSAFFIDALSATKVNELTWVTNSAAYSMGSCVIKYDAVNNVFVNVCRARLLSGSNPYQGIQVTIHNGNTFAIINSEAFYNNESSFTSSTNFTTLVRDISFSVSGTFTGLLQTRQQKVITFATYCMM